MELIHELCLKASFCHLKFPVNWTSGKSSLKSANIMVATVSYSTVNLPISNFTDMQYVMFSLFTDTSKPFICGMWCVRLALVYVYLCACTTLLCGCSLPSVYPLIGCGCSLEVGFILGVHVVTLSIAYCTSISNM